MGYVVPNGGGSRLAYGKRPVAGLPSKKMVFGPTPVHPPRRIRFYQTSDIGDGMVGGHTNQKMHMIASSIHAKNCASNLPDDASEVGMEIFFEFRLDECAALFGAEDEMYKKVRGGVRHIRFFRPFGACSVFLHPTHGLRRGLHSFRRFAALNIPCLLPAYAQNVRSSVRY
jgi:hypothetical protein